MIRRLYLKQIRTPERFHRASCALVAPLYSALADPSRSELAGLADKLISNHDTTTWHVWSVIWVIVKHLFVWKLPNIQNLNVKICHHRCHSIWPKNSTSYLQVKIWISRHIFPNFYTIDNFPTNECFNIFELPRSRLCFSKNKNHAQVWSWFVETFMINGHTWESKPGTEECFRQESISIKTDRQSVICVKTVSSH